MIRLENVSKYYNDGNKTSIGISNINLRFNEKGLILIKGESGSGKTTLLKIISKKVKKYILIVVRLYIMRILLFLLDIRAIIYLKIILHLKMYI